MPTGVSMARPASLTHGLASGSPHRVVSSKTLAPGAGGSAPVAAAPRFSADRLAQARGHRGTARSSRLGRRVFFHGVFTQTTDRDRLPHGNLDTMVDALEKDSGRPVELFFAPRAAFSVIGARRGVLRKLCSRPPRRGIVFNPSPNVCDPSRQIGKHAPLLRACPHTEESRPGICGAGAGLLRETAPGAERQLSVARRGVRMVGKSPALRRRV